MSEHEIHCERVRAAYIQGWIDSVSEPRPFARARESMADRYMDQVQTADSYEKKRDYRKEIVLTLYINGDPITGTFDQDDIAKVLRENVGGDA